MEGGRHQDAPVLHLRLPEHDHLQNRVRFRLRLRGEGRQRRREDLEHRQGEPLPALLQLRRRGPAPRPSEHPPHRLRPGRERRTLARVQDRRREGDRGLQARTDRPHGRPAGGRAAGRRLPPPRGDEHRRQGGAARWPGALRRLRLDAHGGMGREQRHAHPRRPRLRDAAPLRAGRRPRPPPHQLRAERGDRPSGAGVLRHLRHSVRLRERDAQRAADQAARLPPRPRRAARTRPPRHPVPPRARLFPRPGGRTSPSGQVQRTERAAGHAERHRADRRPELGLRRPDREARYGGRDDADLGRGLPSRQALRRPLLRRPPGSPTSTAPCSSCRSRTSLPSG